VAKAARWLVPGGSSNPEVRDPDPLVGEEVIDRESLRWCGSVAAGLPS